MIKPGYGILYRIMDTKKGLFAYPLVESYGIPKRFDTIGSAHRYAGKFTGNWHSYEVRDIRTIVKYVKMVVEHFSGRVEMRTSNSGELTCIVVNENRPTYERLIPIIIKEYKETLKNRKKKKGANNE
jgi:hypothetical protein